MIFVFASLLIKIWTNEFIILAEAFFSSVKFQQKATSGKIFRHIFNNISSFCTHLQIFDKELMSLLEKILIIKITILWLKKFVKNSNCPKVQIFFQNILENLNFGSKSKFLVEIEIYGPNSRHIKCTELCPDFPAIGYIKLFAIKKLNRPRKFV